jgi:hypothetical protein
MTTKGAIFHVDPDTVQTVLNHLQSHHNLTANALDAGEQSSTAKPQIPKGGFKPQSNSSGDLRFGC